MCQGRREAGSVQDAEVQGVAAGVGAILARIPVESVGPTRGIEVAIETGAGSVRVRVDPVRVAVLAAEAVRVIVFGAVGGAPAVSRVEMHRGERAEVAALEPLEESRRPG